MTDSLLRGLLRYRTLSYVAQAAALLAPAVVFGQITPGAPIKSIPEFQTRVACQALSWLYTFALIIAVIYIILAAYKYITSGGSEEKTSAAHKHLIYGLVGIGVAILARGAPFILVNFFGQAQGSRFDDPCGLTSFTPYRPPPQLPPRQFP